MDETMNIQTPIEGKGFNLPIFRQASDRVKSNRMPLSNKLPDNIRNHVVAIIGEFCGTVLFLFFAFAGAQVANNTPSTETTNGNVGPPAVEGANPSQLLYIALCFGFSLAVNAFVFYRISGGLFNPAVTFGLCLVGSLSWIRGTLLVLVQILGGITAAAIVSCLFPGPLTVGTKLSGGTSISQGLFIEMFLTAELVFTIFMLAAEKHRATFIAPIGIGLALFIGHLVGVYFTGAGINPSRAFGPAVVNKSFPGYHWIYWIGPILGALLASGLYKMMKILEYESANPGQDGDNSAHHQSKKPLLKRHAQRDKAGSEDDIEAGHGSTTAIGQSTHGHGHGQNMSWDSAETKMTTAAGGGQAHDEIKLASGNIEGKDE